MKALGYIVTILLVIGGLNWGFVGLFDYNVVSTVFGVGSMLTRIIYVVVGLAAVYHVVDMFRK